MNKEVLLKIKERILAEPSQFNMDTWGVHYVYNKGYVPDEYSCGTAACIGGHAILIAQNENPSQKISPAMYTDEAAQNILGLTDIQKGELFFMNAWPSSYRDRYDLADSPEERARAAADYIDHFIEKHEEVKA